jgi:hypothetical protein
MYYPKPRNYMAVGDFIDAQPRLKVERDGINYRGTRGL